MRITPLDVRKQEFRKAVRGFDCDEVRAFLSTLADEYETVLVDNKQIREMLMEQEDKIQEYVGMERNLRDTLMTAERVMQETRDNASKKGDLIIKDAEIKARQVLEECRLRTEELRREIMSLRKEKESYLGRFKSLAEAQIKFVETHASDFEDLDNRLTDIVDSVVATAGQKRRKTDKVAARKPGPGHKQVPGPAAATATAAPVVLDPFAAENRIEGDPSAPRDKAPDTNETAQTGQDILEVAPPATPVENDIWRDYNPGESGKEAENPGSISDMVSESLAENKNEKTTAGVDKPEGEKSRDADKAMTDGPVLTKNAEPVVAGSSTDTI
ncbi:MAG: DivIVA domain-containing protein [Candidatus Krumholzibacteriota bacterium]